MAACGRIRGWPIFSAYFCVLLLQDLTTMMVERATPMASRFRLTYQTLLLLHAKADSLSVESLLRSSFREAARTTQRPVIKRNLRRCTKARAP